MTARPLRNDENTADHDQCDHCGSNWTAQGKSTMVQWLVEEIAQGSSQGPRQNEGGPEQPHARHLRPVIERSSNRQSSAEHQRSALVSQAACVGDPVAK